MFRQVMISAAVALLLGASVAASAGDEHKAKFQFKPGASGAPGVHCWSFKNFQACAAFCDQMSKDVKYCSCDYGPCHEDEKP